MAELVTVLVSTKRLWSAAASLFVKLIGGLVLMSAAFTQTDPGWEKALWVGVACLTVVIFIDWRQLVMALRAESRHYQDSLSLWFFQQLLNRIPLGISAMDPDHKYLFANPQYSNDVANGIDLLGKDDVELAARKSSRSTQSDNTRSKFDKAVVSGSKEEWLETTRKGLDHRQVLRQYFPVLDQSGQLEMMFSFSTDVTDLLNLQQKVENNEAALQYAQGIQRSLFPSSDEMVKVLGNHVLYHRPKDHVSGDVYWCSQNATGYRFMVVADCTGHGVAASLLSVLLINSLNTSVHRHALVSPASIIEHVHNVFRASLAKGDTSYKNGADMTVCVVAPDGKVSFASANRPIVIVRHGKVETHQPEIVSLGYSDKPLGLSDVQIDCKPDDVIYLYTDGVTDQFGGPSSKKFGSKNLLSLLEKIAVLPMTLQSKFIRNTMSVWQGDNEQVDDICLLGFQCVPTKINYGLEETLDPTVALAESR
jgi:serine phosphatase RsbU (regulator of sigma subunit)